MSTVICKDSVYLKDEYKSLAEELFQKATTPCFGCQDANEFCTPENCPQGKIGEPKYEGNRKDGGKVKKNVIYDR